MTTQKHTCPICKVRFNHLYESKNAEGIAVWVCYKCATEINGARPMGQLSRQHNRK